ncbi:MAG TPA: tetratricopeptide repeat protein [Kofleriaceae bacterium]|nr:tetratricopeptide repeat protein [Kofleriaceae bacterium]
MSQVARRYYERGRTALGNRDLESAQESLRAAVDLAPHYGDARIAYAVALAKAGDHPRAAAVLRAGLGRACSPVLAAAMWATLGDVLTGSGDFLGAEDAFGRARSNPAFAVRSAAGLARVYGKLGRFADMSRELRAAAIGSVAVPPP